MVNVGHVGRVPPGSQAFKHPGLQPQLTGSFAWKKKPTDGKTPSVATGCVVSLFAPPSPVAGRGAVSCTSGEFISPDGGVPVRSGQAPRPLRNRTQNPGMRDLSFPNVFSRNSRPVGVALLVFIRTGTSGFGTVGAGPGKS